MKSASQVLREAKELIGTPEKWCKKALRIGDSFCVVGAMNMVSCGAEMGSTAPGYYGAFRAFANVIPGFTPTWNNAPERTHAEVLQAFDRAIALAEADEKKNAPWTQADTMRVIEGIGSAGQRQSKSDHLAVVTS